MAALWQPLVDRFGALPTAVGSGLLAGVLTLTIPNSLFEGFSVATGLGELVPAAAPPLGVTARILIAIATALLVFGILSLLLVRETRDEYGAGYGEENDVTDLNFAANLDDGADYSPARKPSWRERLRSMLPVWGEADPSVVRDLEDLPKLRREDRHPDAPPRAPLLATRDLADSDQRQGDALLASKSSSEPEEKKPVRKRLGSLIPVDLMNADSASPEEIPLVVKKPAVAAEEPVERVVDTVLPSPDVLDDGDEAEVEPLAVDQNAEFAESTPIVDDPVEDSQDTDNNKEDTVTHSISEDSSDEKPLADLSLPELIARLENGLERLTAASAKPFVQEAAHDLEPVADTDVAPDTLAAPDGEVVDITERYKDVHPVADQEEQPADNPEPQDGSENIAEETEQVSAAQNDTERQPITDPEEMDEALRAALETLRQMTEKQRNA